MDEPHLLVIEDDPTVCELLAGCFRSLNCRVTIARSGEEGLRLLDEDPPQLVVLDLLLSGMNGLDVCRTMRSDPWMEKIPVLMLTGRDDEDDMVAGLEVGADDYVTKPFSTKVLAARVKALLRRGRGSSVSETVDTDRNLRLEIRCLGRCEMQLGKRIFNWAEKFSPALRMLLAALIAAPDGRVSQEEIQKHFWPDKPATQARSNFDSLMTRLRRALELEFPGIDVRHHLLLRRGIISLEHVRVDAHEFVHLAGKGMQRAAAGELWQAELAFSAAFGLWQGSFLPGDYGSDAAKAYQGELEQLFIGASKRYARLMAHSGRYQEAIKLLRYAQRYDPFHEGVIRLLYLLLRVQNYPSQASQLLDHYVELLRHRKFTPEEIDDILSDLRGHQSIIDWLKE